MWLQHEDEVIEYRKGCECDLHVTAIFNASTANVPHKHDLRKSHSHKSHQKEKKGYQFDTLYTVSVHSRRTKDNKLPQTSAHKTTQVVWTIRKTKESQFFIHSAASLQINQASTALLLLLLTLRSRAERVVILARAEARLRRELRCGHTGILALQRLLLSTEEGVVASLCGLEATH